MRVERKTSWADLPKEMPPPVYLWAFFAVSLFACVYARGSMEHVCGCLQKTAPSVFYFGSAPN